MVSIVIPVYNGADYLACAIESALAQSYQSCETIVVNDGSADGGETERIALSFGDRIRYFAKENGGVATAVNLGIENMRGEYFSWLSHDDYYHPDKVLNEIQAIPPGRPDTLIYGDYSYLDVITGRRLKIEMGKLFTQRQLSVPLFPVMFRMIHGSATLIHKSHFDRVGLFDEKQLTTQDYDMWFRAFRNSPIRHCAHCDMTARLHPNSGNQSNPDYLDNACKFWIKTDKALTDAERAEISGTPHRYYQQIYSTVASTKYEALKRYYSAKAALGEYSCDCGSAEEKRALLTALERNCGLQPSQEQDARDDKIRGAMRRYYEMPGNGKVRPINMPQWGLGTRSIRALRRYGLRGALKRLKGKLIKR